MPVVDATQLRYACNVCSWIGFVGSLLTLVLGFVHVADLAPKIDLKNRTSAIDDVQAASWRQKMFSFAPSVFFDAWTPLLFGCIGVLAHVKDTVFSRWICRSYSVYFFFCAFEFAFATVAYCGLLGVIFSVPVIVACLMSGILGEFSNYSASLNFNPNFPYYPQREPEAV